MLGKILVVDDEEIIRESLSFILRKEGYEVDEAENGRVAQSKLLEGKYDIVVTDLEMPQMRGIELLEEIKKLDIHTSIIIITAFGSDRKSTRLNSSHLGISYAVFCLKKKQ